jgi:hypothetical protein
MIMIMSEKNLPACPQEKVTIYLAGKTMDMIRGEKVSYKRGKGKAISAGKLIDIAVQNFYGETGGQDAAEKV